MFNLSLLGKAMLDFSWMSTSQIAALIVAIIFSVCSVATSILAFKYAKKLNSFLKATALTMVAPFLAVASWLFLILSFLDAFRNDEALNIVISILISIFLCGVVIVVSKALYAKNGNKMEMNDTDDAIEGTCEDQTNALPANNTLLLEDEKKVAEEAEETENVEEQPEETEEIEEPVVALAETEEVEETPVEETEEPAEEEVEEVEQLKPEEEVEETPAEEVEQLKPEEEVEETPAEEVEQPKAEEEVEETPVEETEEPAEEEVEEVEETPAEEVEQPKAEEVYDVDGNDETEDEESEEDDEDEEFKKFIEALRERNRMRTSDKPEGDDNN